MVKRQPIKEMIGGSHLIGRKRFNQLPRYLQGIEKRLEKIDIDPLKDQQQINQIQPLLDQFERLQKSATYQNSESVQEVRWMLEELRLSLFSQPLKTILPVSVKRVQKALDGV
jgi:ATP-dependent helicase HrpA